MSASSITKIRHFKLLFLVVVGLIIGVWINNELDIDDHIYAYWKDFTTSESTKKSSIWLNQYTLKYQTQLAAINGNLSGITYNPDTKSFWVIINSPQILLELDSKFNVLRKVVLKNFYDTEALAYAGQNRIIIADEHDQSIIVAPIAAHTTVLDKKKLHHITLNIDGSDNKGFEGVAVNISQNTIYVVRERDPMRLLTVRGLLAEEPGIEIERSAVIVGEDLFLDDLSGLHYDQESGNLLILSHESAALAEVAPDGERVSYLDLVSWFHGLSKDIPQAEGVTMGPDRSLYIVSEPNHLYQFEKQ